MNLQKHREFFIDKIQNLNNPKKEIHDVQKLFIVGEKARSFIEKSSNDAYNQCKDNNKNRNQILGQVKKLINDVNKEMPIWMNLI